MPDTNKTGDKNHQDTGRDGYGNVVQSATDVLQASREKAAQAARRAGQTMESNPLGIVVGGLAIGALAGALVPRSAKEKELLAPVGKRLGETARAATQAAREAGMAELDQRGLTKSAAKDQARGLVDGLVKAATTAGTAAATTATGKADDAKDADQSSDRSQPSGETLDTYQPAAGGQSI